MLADLQNDHFPTGSLDQAYADGPCWRAPQVMIKFDPNSGLVSVAALGAGNSSLGSNAQAVEHKDERNSLVARGLHGTASKASCLHDLQALRAHVRLPEVGTTLSRIYSSSLASLIFFRP